MNTKSVGNIGEVKVLAKFVELGIPVYLPFGDNEKAAIKAEDGKMIFDITSSTQHRKNEIKHVYTPEEIDYFACYNIERQCILLFKVNEVPNTSITVRYEKPKNGQIVGIRLEEDYLIDKILCVETLYDESKSE